MKDKKGFTLIELLAVIVILGLLMAIAIPSVTKYITESRKKTVVSTIGNYITAMVNEVNDLTYTFTGDNTVYAVPIECIALERGGTNPFGAWHQANNAYWAYVLVQYDDETSSYRYGYTFKDSAGYGLYPTSQAKLNEQGKQIQTGLSLSRPQTGKVTNITSVANWNGFVVNDDTNLQVLEAESEGEVGDGKTTCTLCQKGDNYDQVEKNKEPKAIHLVELIKSHNSIVTVAPTLTKTSKSSGDKSGLYSSNSTTSGDITYYFRGNIENNYVFFANFIWRIIRINEDGTVRLILNSNANNTSYKFNSTYSEYTNIYYSNSNITKPVVDTWYQEKIVAQGFDAYVANSIFCEEARVGIGGWSTGNAITTNFSKYTPTFKCSNDGNDKGIINSKVGLITYDEVVYAGGYYANSNDEYYFSNASSFWTMTPIGLTDTSLAYVWDVWGDGIIGGHYNASRAVKPVINLNTNILATGTGTSSDPYVIKTK